MAKITPDFSKGDGLVPAIIQDADSSQVLMLGYMNQEALDKTIESKKVHFFSRSKKRIWMKGESSENVLHLVDIAIDCDSDALLVRAYPAGPTCHNGTVSCFGGGSASGTAFLGELEKVIRSRREKSDEKSYVASLFSEGTKKIAQKVIEEAGETAIEAVAKDRALFKEEAADLLFHYLILLNDGGVLLSEITEVLSARHAKRTSPAR